MSILVHNRVMKKKDPNVLKRLGIFNAKDAQREISISRHTLARWAEQGILQRVGRGQYIHPHSSIAPEDLDFALACAQFGPLAFIGGLSALFYYGLIEQVPQQIWIIVPKAKKSESSHNKYKCLRTNSSTKIGVDKKEHFKITNIERTLIESLKFASKIGPRIVIKATRHALEDGLTTESKLGKIAVKLQMKNTLERYWEAIVV